MTAPVCDVALPDGSGVRVAKRVVPEPAKAAGKAALRQVGRLTSPVRAMPDVLLIGAKRSGSTSLHNYLLKHPQVAPLFPRAAHIKGAHYFDRNATRPLSWYRSFGAIRRPGRRQITVDGSPYYLIHPRSAATAAAALPQAKVIVLLRDPTMRALSQYWDEVKLGRETLPFADALAAEPERLAGEEERILADPTYYSEAHEHLSYTLWGRYATHLERWFAAFGRDRILVLRSESMFEDPAATLRTVTDFLGLDEVRSATFPRFNAAPRNSDLDDTLDRLRDGYRADNQRLANMLDAGPWWE
jgi:hypothetical protein